MVESSEHQQLHESKGAVLAELKRILDEQTNGLTEFDSVDVHAPLFSSEIGLCSFDGIELLCKLEQRYGVTIELEFIEDEGPTLASIAESVVRQLEARAQ